jgi:hypothetical protein
MAAVSMLLLTAAMMAVGAFSRPQQQRRRHADAGGGSASFLASVRWPDYEPISGKAGYFQSLGNHRFSASFVEAAESPGVTTAAVACVQAVWRRSDSAPLVKAVYVRGSSRNQPVTTCHFTGDADSATFTFATLPSETTYHIYYMPFSSCEYSYADGARGACTTDARVVYDAPSNLSCHYAGPSAAFAATNSLVDEGGRVATQATYEARAPFESFQPMEMPMTAEELRTFIHARKPPSTGAVVVPEAREFPIRMRWQIPHRWIGKSSIATPLFSAKAQPGEHFTFQLAVVNLQPTDKIYVHSVEFSALRGESGSSAISAGSLRCMNFGGVDFWGRNFSSGPLELAASEVKALWVALVVDNATTKDVYTGKASISISSLSAPALSSMSGVSMLNVALVLTVEGPELQNGGDDDVHRGTRLHWLDSAVGVAGDSVPAPYTPLVVHSNGIHVVSMLGKRITIGADGQLSNVAVNTAATLGSGGSKVAPVWKQVLDGSIALELPSSEHFQESWKTTISSVNNMSVSWISTATSNIATLRVQGSLDCTGYADWNATITAHKRITDEVRLTVPTAVDNAHFGMGLGTYGGFLDRFVGSSPQTETLSNWLVFDFGLSMSIDGFRIFEYGDGVHDPWHMMLQQPLSTSAGVSWSGASTVATMVAQPSNGTEHTPRPNNQSFRFSPVNAQRLRWIIFDCRPNPKVTHSHVMIEEVEFHQSHSPDNVFLRNNGTEEQSIVSSSSGDGTPENNAWQAVDGRIRYKNYAYGWDAVSAHIPDPPQQPDQNLTKGKTWRWNGQNGENGLWLGSTKAGVRLYLKGDDPLWQAGVPFDSRASPKPPESWNNNGTGGIHIFRNGTCVAFSGTHVILPGQQLSFAWSLLVTPVRPFDLASHFKGRWAQLAGPHNYTQLAQDTVSVVNMHQGNYINP